MQLPQYQAQSMADTPAAGNEPGILHILWKRKFLIVVVALMGLGVGYLHYLQQKPIYQSRARVVLHSRRYDLPMTGISNAPSATDTMHETLLKSPVIAQEALKKHRLDTLASLRGLGDSSAVVANLVSSLNVTSTVERTGSILDFSFRSPQPKDCKAILTAIIDSYNDFLEKNYQDLSQEAVQYISQAQDSLQREIRAKELEYTTFLEETPLLKTGAVTLNVYEQRLLEIEAQRAKVLLDMTKLRARKASIAAAVERGDAKEALTLLVRNNLATERVQSTDMLEAERFNLADQKLLPLKIQEESLLELYGPNHPGVRQVQLEIKAWRDQMLNQPLLASEGKESDFFQVYLKSLEEELSIMESQAAELQVLFEDQRLQAKKLQKDQARDAGLRNELERTKLLYTTVIDRLREINLAKDNTIRMTVVNPPSGGTRISPILQSELTFSCVLGLLAGCALAYLINIADKRFRSPDDVRNYLGLPVVGHVPVFRAAPGDISEHFAALDPALRVVHDPKSGVAEAYRAVRTALYFSATGKSHRLLQVTSPHPGDGKTTSAANLAASIASSGTRVLLVDCDMRRPRCHRLFSCSNQAGVSTVVRGGGDLFDAIQPTGVPNLSLLPSGPSTDAPAELLTHPNFERMLAVLREKYDLVVIDSPPLLAVTDATVIAPRVDGVLLVMRLSRSARESGKRATELLAALGAEVLGVIVNGVGSGDYAYYGQGYSDYSYYGYGNYGYGHGENDEPAVTADRPRIGV